MQADVFKKAEKLGRLVEGANSSVLDSDASVPVTRTRVTLSIFCRKTLAHKVKQM